MWGRLRVKLYCLVLGAALPLLVLLAFMGWQNYDEHDRAARAEVTAQARLVAKRIDDFFSDSRSILLTIGQTLPSDRGTDDDGAQLRRSLRGLPSYIRAIDVFDRGGALRATSRAADAQADALAVADQRHFYDARTSGRFAIGAADFSRGPTSGLIGVAQPIVDPAGELKGIVAASIEIRPVQALAGEIMLPANSIVTIADMSGVVVARSANLEQWAGRNVSSFRSFRKTIELKEGTEILIGAEGIRRLSGFTLTQVAPWIVYAGIPEDAAFARLRRNTLVVGSLAFVVIFLAMVVAWMLAETIRRPIEGMRVGAGVLGSGNLAHRLPPAAPGEIGSLVESINTMAGALEKQDGELRASRSALERNEVLLRTIIESEPACVALIDSQGHVRRMNAAGLRIVGAQQEGDVLGRHAADLVLPEDWTAFREHLDHVLAGHAAGLEFRVRTLGGDVRTLQSSAVPLEIEAGERSYLAVTRDITEEKATAEQMRQGQRLSAVGQLTGGIAHDFNNLLTVIIGSLEEVQDEASGISTKAARSMRNALAAAERSAELTAQLLAFSRRQALSPRSVDINDLIARGSDLLKRTLGEQIEIETILAAGLWLTSVDPGQLDTCLINLAVNARDAMPGGGRLTIETGNAHLDEDYARQHAEVTAGQYVLLSVSDTGSGMSPETLARAFEPFFSTKDVGRGTGLGLSMVYGFVKQSGGHIKIYSEPGDGTTVKLYLPRATVAAADVDDAALPIIHGKGETILVVEDDLAVRELAVRMLIGLGYRVLSTVAAGEALEILHSRQHVDLLFTDVVLPGDMNGRQLSDAARAVRPTLPVLYTSGYTENAIIHHGRLDAGAILLSKPYRRSELATKVHLGLETGAATP